MTGKYAEAARFFDKLQQADEVLTSDWLNAGQYIWHKTIYPKHWNATDRQKIIAKVTMNSYSFT